MKKMICLILALTIVLSLCACGAKDEPVTIEPDVTTPTGEQEPTVEVESENPEVETEPAEPVTPPEGLPTPELATDRTKTDFDAYIIDSAYVETGKNTMFSPLSLDMAIGMVAEGAGSEYHNIWPDLLGKENYAEYAKQYMEYTETLNVGSDDNTNNDVNSDSELEEFFIGSSNNYKTVFEISNSVWTDSDYNILDNYKEKIKAFAAELEALDFSDVSGTVERINAWCKEKTHDMIDKVVSEENFNDDTSAVIVNSVYFESPWIDEWNVCENDKEFTKFDGSKSEVKMIDTYDASYYENEHATAFGARYRNGLTFIGILPKEEGEFMISDLDIESLIKSETYEYDVYAKMPAFKFDNKIENLRETLTNAGYGILFDKDMGMFTQMLNDGNENVPLAISDIIQMDAIELDENGTKAAAVTAIMMETCGLMIDERETKEVVLDRPFAFVIYDAEMDQIVFMGKVVEVK